MPPTLGPTERGRSNGSEGDVQRTRSKESESKMSKGVSPDRLNDILATFSTLRRDGQDLVDRIHGSLRVMRELRSQLQSYQANGSAPNGSPSSRKADLQLNYGLTPRELEVALLLARGRSNSAIAEALHISTHTARHHTQRILTKLRVHSRAEAGAKIRG